MKKIFLFLLLCGFAATMFSAEPTEKPAPPGDRFLFVVETSSTMNRSAKAAQQTVRELIESGVEGEMHPGDTFAVWTFDEQLNAAFPMQRWSHADSKKLAEMADNYLKKQRYEKKSQLKVVLPPVYSVVKASKSITVILISTGMEAISGTPFDKEINMVYPQYSRELRDAKIPFVTVLIGHNGRPVAYSVNSSLGIQIPQPPIKKIAPPQTNAVAVVTNKIAAKAEPSEVPVPNASAAKMETKSEANETIVPPVIPANISSFIVAPKVGFSEQTNVADLPTATKAEPFANESSVTSIAIATNAATFQTGPTEATAVTSLSNVSQNPVRESAPESILSGQKPKVALAPVVASQSIFTPMKLLIAGGALLVVAAVLIVLLVRGSGKSRPSLISHSIDGRR